MAESRLKKAFKFFTGETALATLVSVVFGLAIGAVVLAIAGYNPFQAYWELIKGVFGAPASISWMIIRATPIIITGLSITFAFKTGLFNVGAEGQFMVGTIAAVAVGSLLQLPAIIHIPLTLLAGMLAAGIWGGIAGALKARFGINEVISTIMLNWIAFYLNNYVVTIKAFTSMHKVRSLYIQPTAMISVFDKFKETEAGQEALASGSLLGQLMKTPVNAGILIAIVLAVAVWFILKKTTLGYELKAVGHNISAAEYGGINVKQKLFLSMTIAGMLAGAAGAVHVMGVSKCVSMLAVSEGYGFDGMAVSLIGNSTPFGTVIGGLFYSTLVYGGTKIQATMNAPTEVVNIVTGSIVFFIAIPKLIRMGMNLLKKRRRGAVQND